MKPFSIEETANMILGMMHQEGKVAPDTVISSITLEGIDEVCTKYIALLSNGSVLELQHYDGPSSDHTKQ